MGDVTRSIEGVTRLREEIATITQERSAGIGQINLAVAQLDTVAQQNASVVEQAAAAAGALEQQRHHLLAAAESFRLDETGRNNAMT